MSLLKTWTKQYFDLLKAIEAEELLDLVVYRPAAFVVTKVLYYLPFTPNQVSLASFVFGALTGYLFWQGNARDAAIGALMYFICNTLDCADGQLARMRGNASVMGWVVDGMIDYWSSTAVFIGIAHNLVLQRAAPMGIETTPSAWWFICTAAGLCYAWQCAILDKKRQEWFGIVYKKRESLTDEKSRYSKLLHQYREEKSHLTDRMLIHVYFGYQVLWQRFLPQKPDAPVYTDDQAELWQQKNRPLLRMALWMGPTTQMTAIMVLALFNRLDIFIWLVLSLGNGYALLLFVLQKHADTALARQGLETL